MTDLIRPLAETKRLSDFFVDLTTRDLSNEQAIRRTRDPDGASISWHLGHLCHARIELMQLLGTEVENTFEQLFDRTAAATDGGNYPSIAGLRQSWTRIANSTGGVLNSVTEEELLAPLNQAPHPHEEKNVLGVLSYILWHEVYHIGQIGTLRTQLGLRPAIDVAIDVWDAGG
jgi:uncharacterized damage-inducible protein DinB